MKTLPNKTNIIKINTAIISTLSATKYIHFIYTVYLYTVHINVVYYFKPGYFYFNFASNLRFDKYINE